jgi:hypothetical protein
LSLLLQTKLNQFHIFLNKIQIQKPRFYQSLQLID